MAQTLLWVAGASALLATLAAMAADAILTVCTWSEMQLKLTSLVSAALEAVMLIGISVIYFLLVVRFGKLPSARLLTIIVVSGVLLCALAGAASIVMLISLHKYASEADHLIVGSNPMDFFVAASVITGASFLLQFLFLTSHYTHVRGATWSFRDTHDDDNEAYLRMPYIKSIPYSQTSPGFNSTRELISINGGGRIVARTIDAFKTTVSYAMHPSSSKTRLMSLKEPRRPISMETIPYMASRETFDSWDTSSVDAHTRRAVMEASSLPAVNMGGLEPILARPADCHSPSTGKHLNTAPPRLMRRSWSYSATMSKEGPNSLTPQSSVSEVHIHPLFRSDSFTQFRPAPLETSASVSSDVDQLLRSQLSMWSMTRVRSGSLPTYSSPLRRQACHENELTQAEAAPGERKMTPPLPMRVLNPPIR